MAMGTGRPWWGPPSTAAAAPSSPPLPMSPSSPPSSSFTADPPAEFLCPISGTLMADPVIVPPGQTFERACIQACAALAFFPPAVAVDLSSSSSFSSSSPLVLVPNVALRVAILNWCDRLALPYPTPLSPDTARDVVRRLMPQQQEEQWTSQLNGSPAQGAASVRVRRNSVATEDFVQQEPPARTGGCSLEDEIMAVLGAEDATPTELASAMASLRQATRESREVRRQLCTPRLLAALRPMLLSDDADVQANAAAAVVNLSLEPENKARILRSGAVSPLVDVLRAGHPEARDHAAGAMYSLAVEDENRAAIGVLGAIPPLLELFASPAAGYRARREAGMALYHVSLSAMNRTKIARAPGAVRTLLAAASKADEVRKLAVMVMANLAGCPDGRAALMDGGAVAAVVRLMSSGSVAPGSAEEEYCISALYGMSRGSLRFRGLARAAGVDAALRPVAEGDGGVGRDLARRTLRAMSGEDDDGQVTAAGLLGRQWDDGSSVVSEGLVSIRRPSHRRDYVGPNGSNTTQF